MLTRVHRTFTAAHDACQATQARLKELDLNADEFESVNSARGLDILMKKIQQTTEAREQASQKHPIMKKAGHFVEVFSEFVTRTSVIIELQNSLQEERDPGVIACVHPEAQCSITHCRLLCRIISFLPCEDNYSLNLCGNPQFTKRSYRILSQQSFTPVTRRSPTASRDEV
jgi:hypothetical protein